MSKSRKSLGVLLNEFAAKTSAHGIERIVFAESILWRAFWLVATVTCLGMVLFQGILLIQTFTDKPVKSDIDVTYSRTVLFPAVTICNLNIIKRSFIHRFKDVDGILGSFENFVEGKHNISADGNETKRRTFGPPDKRKKAMMNSLKTDSSQAQTDVKLSNVSVDAEGYAKDQMLSALATYDDEHLARGGHQFNEMVFRCSWKDFSCREGDFLSYWKHTWNWRYGNCFTFNSGATNDGKKIPILTSSKPGPKYGLTLDLFVDQMQYIPSLSEEAGVRVLLTDQRKLPFPFSEGFTVSPGFSTSIGMRKLGIFRVDPFGNGSCYSEDAVENFSIYAKRYRGSKYSVQGCMYSCLARAEMDVCNCTEGKFRFGKKICTELSEVECVQNLNKRYDEDELGCNSKCPQPCKHYSFRTSLSSAAWSGAYEKQLQSMMLSLRSGDENAIKMGKNRDMLRQNFLRIKIYFDELNMETITYREYYMIENLLSDIGGQLGLWVGVSVITVTEFIKLVLDIVKMLCRKVCYQDSKEIGDVSMAM